MITQVLIVHGQLPFAITLKQSLERGAPFEAHPFTSVEGAAEYLREHIQDVALVDFDIPDFPGDQIVRLLREIQPTIAIVATPPQNESLLRELDVQATIRVGFAARELISLINTYFETHERPSYVPPRGATTGLLGRLKTGEQPRVPTQPLPTRDLTGQNPPGTRDFGSQNLPGTRDLGSENPGGTRDLSNENPAGTRDLSGHSSLDDVLASQGGVTNIFGDVHSGEDFSWAHEQPGADSDFDEVLNSLPTESSEEAAPRNPFTDLVNSMRNESAHRPLPSRQEQFVEYILTGGMDSLLEEIEQSQTSTPPPPADPTSVFERLAQEEPPPPTFEESGTVGDLVTGVQDRSFRNVLSILRGEDVQDSEPLPPPTAADFDVGERKPTERTRMGHSFFDDEDDPTPARVILQRALEESVAGDEFSLEELLQSIESQFPQSAPKILPSPTWLKEQQTRANTFMVQEPDFLPEELPPEPTPSSELYPNQTTQPSREQQRQIEAHPEALETEQLEDRQPALEDTARMPRTLPEEFPADATLLHEPVSADTNVSSDTSQMWHRLPDQDFNTQFEMMAAFEVHDEKGVSSGALYTEVPAEEESAAFDSWDEVPSQPEPPAPLTAPPAPIEDPYLAQLALSLTEASLELSAEATLLARDGQIIAFAGRLPKEEVDDLRGAISDDWNAVPGEVRIRFLTARNSGKDYMLYSRRTEDDFTLSLIFAGTTPLRTIRRQGQRLVDALAAVPETDSVKPETTSTRAQTGVQAPVVDTSVRTPYAFVWLLRDPAARLDPTVSQAITVGLNIQMHEQHWNVQKLQVLPDHVYMLADVPGEEPAFKLVRDIKRRSAELAHALNPAYNAAALWSDGYLVVTPGRELDVEEIQQFISFERMD